MAKHPGVTVEWVRDGTPKILSKLRAEIEAGQPQPDVLLIADVVTMEGLKAEGRLMAYPEADTSAYDAGLMDKDKTYFSTKLITTGIVYNTKAPFVPASWMDLAKPEAKGLVAMPSPLTSGAAMIHTVTLTGNLGEGWDFYAELAKNGAQAAGGNGDILKAVSGGDKLYGMIVDYMPIREKAKGAPVEFVFPKEGVSAVTEPVAILSTAKNVEAAKAFIDFILSEEGQKLAVSQGYIPALASAGTARRLSRPLGDQGARLRCRRRPCQRRGEQGEVRRGNGPLRGTAPFWTHPRRQAKRTLWRSAVGGRLPG